MEEANDFEAVTVSNVWIKEQILDVIKEINNCEHIARSGGYDIISSGLIENVEILRTRIDGLNQMESFIIRLKDNVALNIGKPKLLTIEVMLRETIDLDSLLLNKRNQVTHEDNYYLSSNFFNKMDNLSRIKARLIRACAEAELLMPRKDDAVKGKRLEEEDD